MNLWIVILLGYGVVLWFKMLYMNSWSMRFVDQRTKNSGAKSFQRLCYRAEVIELKGCLTKSKWPWGAATRISSLFSKYKFWEQNFCKKGKNIALEPKLKGYFSNFMH